METILTGGIILAAIIFVVMMTLAIYGIITDKDLLE